MPRRAETAHPGATARERAARRRYQAAIAAALESVRRAHDRFTESSAAIDSHIQWARGAVTGAVRPTARPPLSPIPSA